jgi:hypothetical protein
MTCSDSAAATAREARLTEAELGQSAISSGPAALFLTLFLGATRWWLLHSRCRVVLDAVHYQTSV